MNDTVTPNTDATKTDDPRYVLPDGLIEADESLTPAREVYERIQSGETIRARTHAGRLRRIEAAAKRSACEEITEIRVEGLPWPLTLPARHPVLGNTENGKTGWRPAGRIEEGDELFEPTGPTYEKMIFYDRARGATKHNARSKSSALVKAVLAAFNIEPSRGDYVITEDMGHKEEWALNFGLKLRGCKTRSRHSRLIAGLRREIAEYGLPRTLPGMYVIGAIRPIFDRWGTADPDSGQYHFDITSDRVRPHRGEESNLKKPYEPENSVRAACRDAAYTLEKTLAAHGKPGDIVETSSGFRLTLTNWNAAKVLFTKHARVENHRKVRPYRGPCRSTYDREADPAQYVPREAVSVKHRSYEGTGYAFQVEEDSSLVVGGIAAESSQLARK